MKIVVKPSVLNGDITVPGSKSHTIRAVAVAALADGKSIIRNPLISEDAESSLKAAKAFGAKIEKKQGIWEITGTGGNFVEAEEVKIDVGNSGTSLRIFTGLAATAKFPVAFDGDSSLRTRPMDILLDSLEELGAQTSSNVGKCPLSVKGPLKGGVTRIEGKSSQFLTSLLFACPLAEEDTIIKVFNLNEKPYVEMTLDWLSRQGIQLEYSDDLSLFHVKCGQRYSAFEYVIPADFSTATFPLVAAAVTKGKVNIRNLDFNDHQGDKVVFDYIEQMGASVEKKTESTIVTITDQLNGASIDLNSTPDALPAMAVAAACAKGQTRLENVPQARIKETDRISCMTCELRKMGIQVDELEDGMVIQGGKLKGAEVEGYGDHRIVMALAIAGMVAEGETVINGAEAAAVTYPDFVKDFQALGANIS